MVSSFAVVSGIPVYFHASSLSAAAIGVLSEGGGERLFSHSFIKSEADFLMLPGARRLRAAGHVSSLSLLGEAGGSSRDNSFLLHGHAAVSGRVTVHVGLSSHSGVPLSTFSGPEEPSPMTVDPLHRSVLAMAVGLSQLDQS